MRVLQIINSLGTGGAEKLLADSVPLYQKSGIATDVLLLNGKRTPLLEKLETESNGKVFSLGNGSVYSPMHIFRMMRFFKNYDLVHVHLFPSLYWTAIAAMLSFSKIKLVYTEHSTNNRRREKIFFKIFDRIIYRRYDRIVTIAEAVDAALKAHLGLKPQKFEIIHNGIDTQQFIDAKPYPKIDFFPDGTKILIQVSNFRNPKDQKTIIRAMQLLPENIGLLLVGEGPLKAECEKLAQEFGLQNRVKFLGIRMDTPNLLQTADIILLSSAYEGFSLSSIEGMVCGKPFVASDAPGLREIVSGAGILFETGNAKELAQKITHLLSDADYYNKIAAQCLQRAKPFDIHNTIQQYSESYQKVLK